MIIEVKTEAEIRAELERSVANATGSYEELAGYEAALRWVLGERESMLTDQPEHVEGKRSGGAEYVDAWDHLSITGRPTPGHPDYQPERVEGELWGVPVVADENLRPGERVLTGPDRVEGGVWIWARSTHHAPDSGQWHGPFGSYVEAAQEVARIASGWGSRFRSAELKERPDR